jgi:hypothetical protein
MLECRKRAVEAGCKQMVILPMPEAGHDDDDGGKKASPGFVDDP